MTERLSPSEQMGRLSLRQENKATLLNIIEINLIDFNRNRIQFNLSLLRRQLTEGLLTTRLNGRERAISGNRACMYLQK